jgi:hypothetical protein
MSVTTTQNPFVSAIDELRAPHCLDRVPEWLCDLLRDANWSQLRIPYSGHCGIAPLSWVDDQGNTVLFAEDNSPEILRRYLAALAASLLDTYIPSWRFGAGSSGILVLDAEGRIATFHNTTKILATLETV